MQAESRFAHDDDAPIDWPGHIHQVLQRARIAQVAYVPDAGLARIIKLCEGDPAMRTIMLTAEQEGVGLLAGAWLGGERGVLLMQSSGVGNCVNALSLIRTCRFPLLALIAMRGEWGEFNPWQVPMGQTTRASLELAGLIVHRVDEAAEAAATVEAAARLAFDGTVGVAVLIGQRLIGAKSWR